MSTYLQFQQVYKWHRGDPGESLGVYAVRLVYEKNFETMEKAVAWDTWNGAHWMMHHAAEVLDYAGPFPDATTADCWARRHGLEEVS